MKLGFVAAAVAVVMLSSVSAASAAPAANRSAFCGVWTNVCKRVCKDGPALCGPKCGDRAGTCRRTGCFDLWSVQRCDSNPRDVDLTDPKYKPHNR